MPPSAPARSPPARVLVPPLLVALVALATQLPAAFPAAFLWDDVPLLVGSDLYTSPARWGESLGQPLGLETWYWRPLATTSFLVEFLVHGGTAAGFRVTAALLHALTAGAAYALLLRLLGSRSAAVIAALAWALHPVNVEATTWISARFDLLAGLCILLTLCAAGTDGACRGRVRPWLTGALAAAALLSKENAVVLPPLFVLWGLACVQEGASHGQGRLSGLGALGRLGALVGERRRGLVAVLAGLAVAASWRIERLGFLFRAQETSVEAAGGPLEHVLLVGRAAATYAGALVVPWAAVGPAHHGERPIPSTDLLGWTGVVLLVGAVGVAVWLWRAPGRRRTACLLTATLIALAPVLNIVPLDLAGGLHAADRYLYLPSLLATALAADLVLVAVNRYASGPAAIRVRRNVAIAAVVVVGALLAGRLRLLPRWSEPLRFWTWAEQCAPSSSITLSNKVAVLLGDGWPGDEGMAEARATAHRLHVLDTEFASSHLYVRVLILLGEAEEAEDVAGKALQLHTTDVELLILRGRARLGRGNANGAVEDFRAAAAIAGTEEGRRFVSLLPDALAGGAEALIIGPGDRFNARELVARAGAAMGQPSPTAVVQFARATLLLGQTDPALRAIGDGRRVQPIRWPEILYAAAAGGCPPDQIDALQALAEAAPVPPVVAARARGAGHEWARDWGQAAVHYERVTALRPEDAKAWDDYGYALFETGDLPGCESALRRALAADAEFGEARLHLGVLLRLVGREDDGLAELHAALAVAESSGRTGLAGLVQRQLARSAEDARDDGR